MGTERERQREEKGERGLMRLSWSFKAIGRTPKFCFMVHRCTLNRKYLYLQEINKEKRYTKRERGGEKKGERLWKEREK